MEGNRMIKQKLLIVFITSIIASNVHSDCASWKPATVDDISNGSAAVLMESLSNACAANSPHDFFKLQTERIRKIQLIKSEHEKAKYLSLLCGQLESAFQNQKAIVYSIEKKNTKTCGKRRTLLWGKSKAGKPIIRMAVATENGQLKLDEL
jgi:hypothetical protein